MVARTLAVLAVALAAVGGLLMALPPSLPKAAPVASQQERRAAPLPAASTARPGPERATDWHDDEAQAELAEEHYCAH